MAENAPVTDPSVIIEWVSDAKKGSRTAFERLIDVFHTDIFRTVYYRTRSQMDAEDITQDIFTQAFKNIAQLKEVDRFKSWLYRIAINKVRDYYRKKKLHSVLGLFPEPDHQIEKEMQKQKESSDDPLGDIIKKDFWNQIEIAMESLSKMEKEVFMLRFMDHLGIKEISIALKKSESTIKTHLYRSLDKLRNNALLQKLYDKEPV